MWLMERLSGWHRPGLGRLGRLAAGRVITRLPFLRLKAVAGSMSKLATLNVNCRTVPTAGWPFAAKGLSLQTPLLNIAVSIN